MCIRPYDMGIPCAGAPQCCNRELALTLTSLARRTLLRISPSAVSASTPARSKPCTVACVFRFYASGRLLDSHLDAHICVPAIRRLHTCLHSMAYSTEFVCLRVSCKSTLEDGGKTWYDAEVAKSAPARKYFKCASWMSCGSSRRRLHFASPSSIL
jgi:hypothetical protein